VRMSMKKSVMILVERSANDRGDVREEVCEDSRGEVRECPRG
jgi:hypothetical protein